MLLVMLFDVVGFVVCDWYGMQKRKIGNWRLKRCDSVKSNAL